MIGIVVVILQRSALDLIGGAYEVQLGTSDIKISHVRCHQPPPVRVLEDVRPPSPRLSVYQSPAIAELSTTVPVLTKRKKIQQAQKCDPAGEASTRLLAIEPRQAEDYS